MGNAATTKQPAQTEGKCAYKVLKNLRHDGKGYAPGATVQLTEKQAKPLLTLKVVEAIALAPSVEEKK